MSVECHEQGTVSRVLKSKKAVVTVGRGDACGACAAKGACQTLGGPSKILEVEVDNQLGANPGDVVQLTMQESAVIKASAILYLVPALGLIFGASAGYVIAQKLEYQSDPLSILGAFTGMGLGLLLSYLLGKRAAKLNTITPLLTRIIKRS
jgi:sigma-E factor negative regulatory protein RseC